MDEFNRKSHWNKVYDSKQIDEFGWYQPTPKTSLNMISDLNLSKSANIIDIGGGDSYLVDHLLDLGYEKITVLDISKTGIERAKRRLGERSSSITWIEADISNFVPSETYDLWHDRATFHFLTNETDIKKYRETAQRYIRKNGNLIIGTFSINGPETCSGLNIRQYSEEKLSSVFAPFFKNIQSLMADHETPFKTIQNFIFCSFKKI